MNVSGSARGKIGVFLWLLFFCGGLIFVAHLFAATTVNVTGVTVAGGYRQMDLAWNYNSIENTATNLFAVYRADDALGRNAHRVALLGSAQQSFADVSLVPGKSYSYAVVFCSSRDNLNSINTSTLSWAALKQTPSIAQGGQEGAVESAHNGGGIPSATGKSCGRCHVVHDAAGLSEKLLKTTQDSQEPNPKNAICQTCHMKTGVPEKNFVETSLSQTAGHTIKNARNATGTLVCLTCHGVHQNSSQGTGALTASTYYKFGSLTQDISVNQSEINAQCVGCHDDDQTWYSATHESAYPSSASLESTQSISSGLKTYPTIGTYLGKTIANNTTKNGHANISSQDTYAKGDCRYCHSSHANGVDDMLLSSRGALRAMKSVGGVVSDAEKTSGAYASFCLSCHNGSNSGTPWAGAANIADVVSIPAGSTEASRTAFLASASGHRITSSNAEVPAGSALPCYTCHNPHGSKNGNSFNLNDELGSNLTGNRATCLTCHTTSDDYVLGSDGSSYNLVSASTPECIGLSRTGSDDVNGTPVANKLKLPSGVEAHTKDGTMPCTACHGGVHAPQQASGTGDSDGKSCLQCHNAQEFPAALQYEFTASGSAEAIGWESGYNPHLIPAFSASMGETFLPELILTPASQAIIPLRAPALGTYQSLPTEQEYLIKTRKNAIYSTSSSSSSQVGPYCAGCHAWHSAEVGSSSTGATPGRDVGNTLRKNYNSTTTANTDYIHTPGSPKLGGLCLSCHNDYLGSASVGAPTRGPLNSLNTLDSELFNNCFHNYSVTITRTTAAGGNESSVTKTYNANCAKCHNDASPIANPLENKNSLDLKVHYVPGRRLLARFGIIANISSPAVGSSDAETNRINYNNRGMCFGCHARKGEIAGNAGKNYAGKDWYGQKDINSAPTETYAAQGWVYDSAAGLKKRQFKNSSGAVIGTLTVNNEATFDDMYKLSAQSTGYPSGDGTGGSADTAAKAALTSGREIVGHQPDIPKSEWNTTTLKPHIINDTKIQAIRCSDCHNVHATATGAMGTHVEWPTTKKALVGTTNGLQSYNGNALYADTITPSAAIASDGERLITLNDFWSRNSLVDDVKSVIVAWLQTPAGGSYSATAAETKYGEMDYNGISAQDIATAQGTTINEGLALQWSRSVDIFCFRCHEETALGDKAHMVNSHKSKALACVECHVPTVHGGKLKGLIADRESIPGIDGRAANTVASGHTAMQPHQIFRWASYSHQLTNAQTITLSNLNVPIARLSRITPNSYANKNSCMSLSSGGGCHSSGKGGGTADWTGAN